MSLSVASFGGHVNALSWVWDVNLLEAVLETQPGGSSGSGMTNAEFQANFPLPVSASIDTTGLATDTGQTTGNNSLASIDTKLTSPLTVTGALTDTQIRASALPVSLASVPSHAVTNAGTFAVQVTSAPTTAVTGTFFQATQPVSGTFFQATQPVSGTVTANAGTGPFPVSDNAGSLTVDAPVTTPAFVRLSDGAAAITALPVTDNAGSLTVDGTVTSNAGTNLNTSALNLEATQTAMSAKLPASLGQKTMAASMSIAIASDQGAISTQKAPTGGANVLKTGTITTTATTADQVVLTYTVTAAKTFYLQYVVMYGRLTTPAATATVLGAISLETPSGTKVMTFDDMNPTTSELEFNPMPFPEPIPVAAGVVVRVVVTPAAITSMLWRANFGGYEK